MLEDLGVTFIWISPCASCANDARNGGGTLDAGTNVVLTHGRVCCPARGEACRCQNLANPFGGEAVDVDRFVAHMPEGAHHSIVNHAGQILFSDEDIDVPPSVPTKVTRTCMMPKDVSLLGASAHVHRHAVPMVGESALTDEMCILGGVYYPVDEPPNPNIPCL